MMCNNTETEPIQKYVYNTYFNASIIIIMSIMHVDIIIMSEYHNSDAKA